MILTSFDFFGKEDGCIWSYGLSPHIDNIVWNDSKMLKWEGDLKFEKA